MSPDTSIADELRRALRTLTWATIILYAALVAIVALGYIANNNRADENARAIVIASQALCELRNGIDQRIAGAEDFLRTHPNGTRDFSKGLIESGLARDKDARRRLAVLDCPPLVG